MAKQDVIKAVHEKMGGTVSQENISKVLDATFGAIKTLDKDQSCRINDFGTFKVKERAARKGTAVSGKGKTIDIPARLAMTFKMATKLKESVNTSKKKAPKKEIPKKEIPKKEIPLQLVSAQSPAGFRDYQPSEVAARHQMITTIRSSYERFGFEPLDTPAVEFLDTLLGPASEQDDESAKMLFETRRLRGREVAGSEETEALGLRFDLTVPLARYVASKSGQLPRPFKRYQVGPVWRGERPQKGRFCEFLQFDLDVVGSHDLYTDAEVMWGVHDTLVALGVDRFMIRINSRKLLNGLPELAGFAQEKLVEVIRVLDKLDKVKPSKVFKELGDPEGLALSEEAVSQVRAFINLKELGSAAEILDAVEALSGGEGVMAEGAADLRQICAYLEAAGVPSTRWRLDLSIARGLGYYTGAVFETTLLDLPKIGSVCSGGRYDGLISRFSSDPLPAVGASIGVDRLFVALQELKQLTVKPTCVQVLVTQMEKDRQADYVGIVARLRRAGLNVALYQGENTSFKAQISFATKREIPAVIICGGREFRDGVVSVKDMAAREQHTVPLEEMAACVQRVVRGAEG